MSLSMVSDGLRCCHAIKRSQKAWARTTGPVSVAEYGEIRSVPVHAVCIFVICNCMIYNS